MVTPTEKSRKSRYHLHLSRTMESTTMPTPHNHHIRSQALEHQAALQFQVKRKIVLHCCENLMTSSRWLIALKHPICVGHLLIPQVDYRGWRTTAPEVDCNVYRTLTCEKACHL